MEGTFPTSSQRGELRREGKFPYSKRTSACLGFIGLLTSILLLPFPHMEFRSLLISSDLNVNTEFIVTIFRYFAYLLISILVGFALGSIVQTRFYFGSNMSNQVQSRLSYIGSLILSLLLLMSSALFAKKLFQFFVSPELGNKNLIYEWLVSMTIIWITLLALMAFCSYLLAWFSFGLTNRVASEDLSQEGE